MSVLVGVLTLIFAMALNLPLADQENQRQIITSKSQIDSALIPWVEKINGTDKKYFVGKNLLIPKDTGWAKSYSPLPAYDSLLATRDSVIVVFLEKSLLGVYEHGCLMAWAPITRGRKVSFTPLGEYAVLDKARLMYSKKYGNVPMPYSLHLVDNICIHQGPMVGRGASHGCIRLF